MNIFYKKKQNKKNSWVTILVKVQFMWGKAHTQVWGQRPLLDKIWTPSKSDYPNSWKQKQSELLKAFF